MTAVEHLFRGWRLEVPEGFQNLHHLLHRGTYTYDGAGRLIQVVDAATNTTETYVWNADGTLASFPGPGYTRLLKYDEEGRLVRIRRDYGGGNVPLAYEYGYGFDGGRRLAEGLPERGVDAVSLRGSVRRWRVGGADVRPVGQPVDDECSVFAGHLAGAQKQRVAPL